ncbi:PtdIns(3 5)P(2) sythesis regulation factor [Mactra antiquata]
MVDKEFAPLTTVCVRALNDKLYEKRKVGALEIERMVKEFTNQQQDQQIKAVLKILGDNFALSSNPNSRKGGLIGLAAAAIALGKESCRYVNELVKPVLACLRDADSQVRYYSCEALYNIVKVTRGSVLPFFNEIFDALSKLTSDPDQNVKSGTELLDRLIKDIVTESASFDLVSFVPLLRERIYNKNPYARQFLVSWIITLDAVPDINMLVLLPEFLDGLFEILGDSNQEIRKMCQSALREFLSSIKKSQSYVNYSHMANILIIHSENLQDDLISFTAITWLKEFVVLADRSMLPFVSGILRAILPRLVSNDIDTKSRKNVKEAAESLNVLLMDLIKEPDDTPTPNEENQSEEITDKVISVSQTGEVTSTGTEEVVETTGDKQKRVYKMTGNDMPSGPVQLDVQSVINVLCELVKHKEFETRIASLKWFKHLLLKVPNKTFRHMDLVFPELMNTLADIDQSDEAMLLALETLARITSHPITFSAIDLTCSKYPSVSVVPQNNRSNSSLTVKEGGSSSVNESESSSEGGGKVDQSNSNSSNETGSSSTNKYFMEFMVQLLDLFKTDRKILDKRGAFIIRHLCLLLTSDDIFRSLSEILVREVDVKFSCIMVQTLNTILLTSSELFELRNQLKDLHSKESCQLFCCLYRSWSHSPVATLALCYLSQNYTHACRLLPVFGDLEITVDFLNEIDKLIQLIESPIFAYLRLQLLDSSNSQDLIKSLYGLLMLLPQAEPFTLLRNRLNCIPNFQMAALAERTKNCDNSQQNDKTCDIDFDELLEHFKQVQIQHRHARRHHHGYKAGFTMS